ncbi:MAG: hypothetical protein NC191_10245 [Muribaculaceae bacterium]|nr:hypothetical protein [Muribaculaceae bacterium]
MAQNILLAELIRFETYVKQFKQQAGQIVDLYQFFEKEKEFEKLDDDTKFKMLKCASTAKRMCELDDEIINRFKYLKIRIIKNVPAID